MMQTVAVAFLGGVVICHQLPVLPSAWLHITILPLIFLVIKTPLTWQKATASLLLGFLWTSISAHTLLSQQLEPGLIGKDLVVTGYVASLPEVRENLVRFEFEVNQLDSPSTKTIPARVRLSWYNDKVPPIRAGDQWQLTIRIKPPRNYYNPGSYDYAGLLFERRILAVGYVREKANNHLITSGDWSYLLQRGRQHIRMMLQTRLAANPLEPVVRGLVIGDRSGMSQQDWSVLRNTGTVHLLAISGLHIGLVAGLVFWLVRRLWSSCSYCCLRFDAPRVAALSAWVVALVYSGLAGFSIPTQRAMLMLSVVLFSIVWRRKTKPLHMLGLVLFLVLIFDPFAVLSPGFWLSFVAVALIYYFLFIDHNKQNGLWRWFKIQILISLALFPIILLFFQQAPILSPLANIIAVPWISFLTVPLALISVFTLLVFPVPGSWLLDFTVYTLGKLWEILCWISQFESAVVTLPSPGLLALLSSILGLIILVLPRGIPQRGLGLFLCLPLFFTRVSSPDYGEANVTVLDVGQGLSTVVQTSQHVLVFDTGPAFGTDFDTGQAVIIPYLQTKGVKQIDLLVISHGDNDHIGGTNSLLSGFRVKRVTTSLTKDFPATFHPETCYQGNSWLWDGVQFEFLHPSKQDYARGLKENNLSCVLQIRTLAQKQVLLTGDIEHTAERLLVQRFGEKLHSSVLVVPHHGSRTSSGYVFLQTVNPEVAIIPVGWRNRFKLPSQKIIRRYDDLNISLYDTSKQGAVSLDLGQDIRISSYQQIARRFWHYHDQENGTSSYGVSLLK